MIAALREGFRKKTRCGELAAKTAILGGFRRVGEIWVAAEEHSGSVKRSLSAGFAWKKRGNGSVAVAGASDAKTGTSLASGAVLGPCWCNVAEIHVF